MSYPTTKAEIQASVDLERVKHKDYWNTTEIAAMTGLGRTATIGIINEMKALGLGCIGRGQYPADEVRDFLKQLAHQEA